VLARHGALEGFLVDIRWPGLSDEQWAETRDTLHLWTQVIGKIKLALTRSSTNGGTSP
jgi:hypothetical protein